MSLDRRTEPAKDKFKKIEVGLKCLRDLNLLDDFFDETWKEGTDKFLDRYEEKKSFYDLSLEETDKVIEKVTEWFGDDYGLAVIDGEFWMVAVGNVEEGGNKWWFKMKLKTDDIETARKVILLDKCRPRRY
jgi:predicted transcriptional regulator